MFHSLLRKRAFPKCTRGEVDWSSPETLVVLILAVLLGVGLLLYVLYLKGKLIP